MEIFYSIKNLGKLIYSQADDFFFLISILLFTRNTIFPENNFHANNNFGKLLNSQSPDGNHTAGLCTALFFQVLFP